MNLEYYQKRGSQLQVGDLVCYKNSGSRKLCGIITEINEMPFSAEQGGLVKIYWCIDNDGVDISPLSYPPIRKNGWVAAELLKSAGSLEVVSKKNKKI